LDITKAELQEILLRSQSTKPGPWKSFVEGRDHTSGSDFIQTATGDIELTGATSKDQDFMAAAKQDIPKLVAVIATLKGWSL
jgi:hypothetical protein